MAKKKYTPDEMQMKLAVFILLECQDSTSVFADKIDSSAEQVRKMKRGDRPLTSKAAEILGYEKVKETYYVRAV